MSYSIATLPNKRFKVQFRSYHINGSINKTFPSESEAIKLGEELNLSLNNLLDGEKAMPPYPPQILLDSIHPLLQPKVLHRPFMAGLDVLNKGVSTTISMLIDNYMQWYINQTDKSDYAVAHNLQWWSDNYGDIPIEDFTSIEVSNGIEKLISGTGINDTKPKAPQTSNRYKANLSSVFVYAIKPKRVNARGIKTPLPMKIINPTRLVTGEPESKGRRRSLTIDEQARVIEASKLSRWKSMYAFVLMAITTGGRKGELKGLRWKDIDWDNGTVFVLRSKNGDSKSMKLIPKLKDELYRLRLLTNTADINIKEHLIFRGIVSPYRAYTEYKCWLKVLEQADIQQYDDRYNEKIVFHSLRHTFCSTLHENGEDLKTIQSLAGHRDISTTLRYTHDNEEIKSKAINNSFASYG